MTALQGVVSRVVSPLDTAVVSATKIHGGTAYNVIPEEVTISGNVRAYRNEVMDAIENAITRIAAGTAALFDARAAVDFRRVYPPLVNHAHEAIIAADAAAEVVGEENVERDGPPRTASEDFAFMLEARPGAYVFLGGGGDRACDVHHPEYDFNDETIPAGCSWWAEIVERRMAIA